MTAATSVAVPDGHDWRAAGAAWGHAAVDWACLHEHYATEVVDAVLRRTRIGPGTEVLDVACGAGLALRRAIGCGAIGAGIDAAEPLIRIARDRLPDVDLRVGSMFELPWPDASFDVVMSINGVWGECEPALHEAFRVLRPGGLIAISFWGSGPPLDLRDIFKAFARHAPAVHLDGMKRLNNIARAGVAEAMLTAAGFTRPRRDRRISVIEWPDLDLAWRALSSAGPAVPALRHGDLDALRADVLAAVAPCVTADGIVRLRNDHQFVIAGKPRTYPSVRGRGFRR